MLHGFKCNFKCPYIFQKYQIIFSWYRSAEVPLQTMFSRRNAWNLRVLICNLFRAGVPGHFGLHIFALSYLLYHVLIALNFTLSFKAVVVCCLLLYFMEDVRLTRARRLNMVCSSSRGCSAYRVNLFAYPRIGEL